MPKPHTVESYIAAAPPDQRVQLESIRALIRDQLAGARESLGSSGFPVYTDGGGRWLAGFATRRKGPMLYLMDSALLDRYEPQPGNLRSGKSCIEWRATESLSLDALRALARRMLREMKRSV